MKTKEQLTNAAFFRVALCAGAFAACILIRLLFLWLSGDFVIAGVAFMLALMPSHVIAQTVGYQWTTEYLAAPRSAKKLPQPSDWR